MRYEDRQFQRDREWKDAWKNLPPAERQKLEGAMSSSAAFPVEKRKGKVVHETNSDELDGSSKIIVGRDVDAAMIADQHPDFCTQNDIAEQVDSIADKLQEQFDVTADQAARIAKWHSKQVQHEAQRQISLLLLRIIGFFLLPGNLLLRAHALAHAARLATLNGIGSMRESARICGVARSGEAIRKVAWRWVELLGLPPLEGAKSEEARKKYSTDKKTNHWRKQKCKAKTPAPGPKETTPQKPSE